MQNPQEYYQQHGPMTSPGANAAEFNKLPKDLAKLCEVVQGVLIHRDMAPFLYNLNLSKEQRDDGNIRPLAQMLTRIHALDPRPLTAPREPGPRPHACGPHRAGDNPACENGIPQLPRNKMTNARRATERQGLRYKRDDPRQGGRRRGSSCISPGGSD